MPDCKHEMAHGPDCLHCTLQTPLQGFLIDHPHKCQACMTYELATRLGELVGAFSANPVSLQQGITNVATLLRIHAEKQFKIR